MAGNQVVGCGLWVEGKAEGVTCKICKVAMKELKGHVYHKQRKWRCPICARVKMQKQPQN